MWLIDAAYLFNAQESVGADYNFDYLKLRLWLEQFGPIDDAWYLSKLKIRRRRIEVVSMYGCRRPFRLVQV